MAKEASGNGGIPAARLEALTDGVFAFAMTLLVLNLELPDDFSPKSPGEIITALAGLQGGLIAYVISFLVLAVLWIGRAQVQTEPKVAGGAYTWCVLAHLFFITLVPFSTMVVGRYGHLWPAVWVYSANMILLAVAALGISYSAERAVRRRTMDDGQVELTVLLVSAVLAAVIGLFHPGGSSYAYFLNFASPWIKRWVGKTG